jgi:hypothetical protein
LTRPIVRSEGASLFVLDDEGVFFFAPRQELYIFNTAATFLWCCIEEGLAADGIAKAWRDACGVDAEDASAQVANLLNQWWSLGYIEDPEIPPVSEIPLVTAVGRLLCNPALRAQFANSPDTVTRKLGVCAADADTLRALDPRQLEAQAQRISARPTAWNPDTPNADTLCSAMVSQAQTLSDYAVECRLRGLLQPPVERTYRLLNTIFRVRFGSAAQASNVHPALAGMAFAPADAVDVCLDVVEGACGCVILEGVIPLHHCQVIGELAPKMKDLLRQIALNRDAFFMELHAGVVADGLQCVILPGAPGSGKTTLTAGLVFSGFEYFSDEVALLDHRSLRLRPVPLGLGIKPGAVEILARYFPEVSDLPVHGREDGQQVRYLSLSAAQTAPHDVRRDAGWLIFPQYGRDLDTALRPISRPTALRRLMREIMVLPRPPDAVQVEELVRWMRRLRCYELPMNSLDDAVRLVKELCRRDDG